MGLRWIGCGFAAHRSTPDREQVAAYGRHPNRSGGCVAAPPEWRSNTRHVSVAKRVRALLRAAQVRAHRRPHIGRADPLCNRFASACTPDCKVGLGACARTQFGVRQRSCQSFCGHNEQRATREWNERATCEASTRAYSDLDKPHNERDNWFIHMN